MSSRFDHGVRRPTYSAGVSEHETAVGIDMVAGEADEQEPTGFNVVLRLANGERLEAGSFMDAGAAHAFAEQFIAEASTSGKWPRVGDRYLRPETLVSVDVDADTQPRWTGSTGRATSWTGRSGG